MGYREGGSRVVLGPTKGAEERNKNKRAGWEGGAWRGIIKDSEQEVREEW